MSMPSRALRRGQLIDRPALLAALDDAFNRRLTLVTGHAGSGKTTLVRQWAASHPDRNFVSCDIEAPDDGLILTSPVTVADAFDECPETVLLLDDVRQVTNMPLAATLSRFIDHLPPTVHVVLTSRADPPVAVSRYRLDQDLLEVRPAELVFTENEAAELLHMIVGSPLSTEYVSALRERTEGWAAGLRLAGLHLRRAPGTRHSIAEFTGSHRLVADYFDEEVLAALSVRTRRILLEISALDDMSAEFVEATTGIGSAQCLFEELEHQSLFLVPLDAHRRWFRFHRMFSELLRARLRAENPVGELQTLTAAADWHLARGHVRDAFEYLSRAKVLLQTRPDILTRISPGGIPEHRPGFAAQGELPKRIVSDNHVGFVAEPLTERELEIISFLPTRLTNGELACRCFISVNTIKTHLAHIYRKLGVSTRNDAILRARELGLLWRNTPDQMRPPRTTQLL